MFILFINRFWSWFSLGFGLVLFFSCNTSEPAITNNSNTQAISPAEQSPVDYFTSSENMLEQDSLNVELRSKLAIQYYSVKNYDRAIYHLLIVQEIDKKNLPALIYLGNAYYDTQQNEKAIEFYEKAIAIDNKNIGVRCDLATCYLRINLPKKTIKILNENIKMNYNHAQSHYNLSIVNKQIGKNKEADDEMKIYNQLIATQKNNGF